MSKIDRVNGNYKAFASEQLTNERTTFGTEVISDDLTAQQTPEYLRGMGTIGPTQYPTLQDFNAVHYSSTQSIAYLHQMGIAEWNADQEYPTEGATCIHNGVQWFRKSTWTLGDEPGVSGSWTPASATIQSVFDPEFANLVEGQAVELIGYHPDTTVGVGSGVVKSARHNGGTAISLTRARPTDWSGDLTDWFADSGVDELCFVRTGLYRETPEIFGATVSLGENQTPSMQALEDWGYENNKPTFYNSVIYEMQTKLVLSRAPQMHGTGGGNGSLRTKKLLGTRVLVGTIFLSKVVGDYCLELEPDIFDFGGRMEDITVLGRLDNGLPKVIGHGVRIGNWGWSAQVNNLSIEDFQGKGLSVGYLQDTVFNSLTILGCSNGAQEPELEFTAASNFLYFNNAHIEDCDYMIRCKDGTNTPWEVHWSQAHFETGNYFAGQAANAPDPSLEHRYTTSPIYANQSIRDWSFSACKFVPCSVQALAADSDGLVDNKPHFIRFELGAGISFDDRCRFENGVGGIDTVFIGSIGVSSFGKSNVNGMTIRNANPTKYSISLNHADVLDLDMHFYTGGNSPRCYGIRLDNGSIDKVVFGSVDDAIIKTEGYLINSTLTGQTKVGTITSDLSIPPYKWVNKLCQCTSKGHEVTTFNSDITIDLERYHPDVVFIHQGGTASSILDITNPMRGKELSIINRGVGNVTVTATSTVVPSAGNTFGADTMIKLYSDGTKLYRI